MDFLHLTVPGFIVVGDMDSTAPIVLGGHGPKELLPLVVRARRVVDRYIKDTKAFRGSGGVKRPS